MERIDGDHTAVFEMHGMRGFFARHLLAVLNHIRVCLRINILIKRSAKGGIQHLMTTTNAHQRNLAIRCQADQQQVITVAQGIDILQGRKRFFTHEERIDIAAATHQNAI